MRISALSNSTPRWQERILYGAMIGTAYAGNGQELLIYWKPNALMPE